ncbi:MAG TPA: hypothetical protein VHL59_04910 [Thermoanaerobaculia bacterium]|nr:hypothetical protein [Thermoanaerobaculia bacterium]
MSFVVTAIALLLFGWGCSERMWRRGDADAPGPLERACAAVTIALATWLAVDWLLALTHTLTRPMLLARTGVALLAALLLLIRAPLRPRIPVAALFCIVPTALWSAFMLWRGAILPPLTHDALSNHLPRAVLYSRLDGFADLSRLSPAFRDIPVNYEILLADILTLLGHDRYTEWLNTLLYVAFVVVAGALAQRWWRSAPAAILVMTLVAGVPVLLLHAGADKNDLLTATFMAAALVWGGRYWRTGDYRALLLLGASVLAAFGTKPQGGIIGAALLPFVLLRAVRDLRAGRLRVRALAGAAVFGVAGFILLGGYTYVDHRLPREQTGSSPLPGKAKTTIVRYGEWENLWQAPYVLLMAPFEVSPFSLDVPWEPRPWFWKRYEIYFSHLGIPFSLCVFAAPFAVGAWREREGRGERIVTAGATLATVVAMLPVVFSPHGMYTISLPRYVLFAVAPAMAWSAGAACHALSKRSAKSVWYLAAGAAVIFASYAIDFAVNDSFAPLGHVLRARETPGTRYIPFDPDRATSVVDLLAGPHDVIAVDAVWATWIHPLFGKDLTRPVYFIRRENGPLSIPATADWVVVERAFNVVWRDPRMRSLADARTYFLRNVPSADETRVADALRRDPRFRLVWEEPRRNQAVFRRIR